MSDFGGTTISSSIYREQIAVNGILCGRILRSSTSGFRRIKLYRLCKESFLVSLSRRSADFVCRF